MSTAALVAIGQNSVLNGLESFVEVTPIVWVYGLLLGIVGTVLPSFLMNAGISRIGARATSSTAALGPVATIILAVLILGEEFTLFHAIGTALVLVGALYFARTERRGLRPLD
jgi:drug/metabolite transporter (DMT)-like permease